MSAPRTPRVLLLTLSRRTSAKGNSYLSGYLGKTSVVGFPGEPDKFGNETWDLFVSPAPSRQQPAPTQSGAWGDGPDAGDTAGAEPDFLHKDTRPRGGAGPGFIGGNDAHASAHAQEGGR